ncbi:hypothetical protein V2J09_008156 [Rumex salicifolius]
MKGEAVKLLLICSIILSLSAIGNGYSHCNCEDEGFWTTNRILECQRVSDFFIAIAYFSIPIELLYFVSCSNFPFKWVFLQFFAFIVLCGMTHLLNGWTYYGPHSFQLMMSLTIFKFLTALVSCATAITLLTLIPLLLKVKVRELFLRQNVLELDQEVGMMKRKKETSLHVRMLTQEIRKSLDKHTILYTTLVELSKTLDLQNCAVWMPNDTGTEMNLTHELKGSSSQKFAVCLPINDPDVMEIIGSKGVKNLRPDSTLGMASSGDFGDLGSVAAIRMPMLRVSNFKGGTPEYVQTFYAILVLVFPSSKTDVSSYHDLEIVEVVADQVAVALSHADILAESQMMREQLAERNRALQLARKNALMASQARNAFQKVMSNGMRRPMHSILGLLSIIQDENMKPEQKAVIETMVRTSNVLSTLVNDVMEIPEKDDGRFPLEMRPFHLHSVVKDAACLVKSLFMYEGISFSLDVQSSLPDKVVGDDRRTFQVVLHMVGYLLNVLNGSSSVLFQVSSDNDAEAKHDKLGLRRSMVSSDYVNFKLEFEFIKTVHQSDGSVSTSLQSNKRRYNDDNKEMLSFSMCKKLVQMMQGDIWISSNPLGQPQSMTLQLRLKLHPFPVLDNPMGQMAAIPSFQGLRVMLADDDSINRTVTKKLLEKMGCQVTAVSSGFECLSSLGPTGGSVAPFQVIMLDLHMPEMDGFDVTMRIRKFHSRSGPLIIALTASAEESIWEKCSQMGMNGLIRKPVPLMGIADELRRVLHRSKDVTKKGLFRGKERFDKTQVIS